MKDQLLEIKTALQVGKPAPEVFDAITDPLKMSQYFISKSSGKMEEGSEVRWQFPEFRMEFPVKIGKMIKNEYISFYWEAEGKQTQVEISLTPVKGSSTLVSVTEKGIKNDDPGIKWLKGNTEGWANFLACLKAWVEYGINLRKGAFDFMSDKNLEIQEANQ